MTVVDRLKELIKYKGYQVSLADRVAPHKKVRQVEMIDFIPESASGKILRKDLRSKGALV
ncbi:hypothetical protein E3O19_04275 [Cryobacterium algoritolerans]|uniref:AMP-binding enzyme C-terminal domain-containing protein n=1 Tax=Cryobacterium algoritolerans TaxID=1259184 RepID=A0A4R8WVU4_9MICO|nr:hypothetical protein E3O19_04275 [Cryobacterium algoritolerans]